MLGGLCNQAYCIAYLQRYRSWRAMRVAVANRNAKFHWAVDNIRAPDRCVGLAQPTCNRGRCGGRLSAMKNHCMHSVTVWGGKPEQVCKSNKLLFGHKFTGS